MKNLMFLVVVAAIGFLARANLPTASVDSILESADAGLAARGFIKTSYAIGLVKVDFSDAVLFRTARVQAGQTDLTLIGLPFVGWYKL